MWNFKMTDGTEKGFKMIDTFEGHYGIILEPKRNQDYSILFWKYHKKLFKFNCTQYNIYLKKY